MMEVHKENKAAKSSATVSTHRGVHARFGGPDAEE